VRKKKALAVDKEIACLGTSLLKYLLVLLDTDQDTIDLEY
jgi:hypothetical protein